MWWNDHQFASACWLDQFISQETLQIENSANWTPAKTKNVCRKMSGGQGPKSCLSLSRCFPACAAQVSFSPAGVALRLHVARYHPCLSKQNSEECDEILTLPHPSHSGMCYSDLRHLAAKHKFVSTLFCLFLCFRKMFACSLLYKVCVWFSVYVCADIQLCSHYSRSGKGVSACHV